MRENASLEHLLERVTLVKGSGDRGQRQLCVMSLAALIAGERHSDAPNAVSPFIRRFAIAINDCLPHEERQRLKLFAPRMVGTDDLHDGDRARLLLSILTCEIGPALREEDARHWSTSNHVTPDPTAPLDDLIGTTLQRARKAVTGKRIGEVADSASELLTTYAKTAPTDAMRRRCWSRAIDVLDRLCSVRDERGAELLSEARIAAANTRLDTSGMIQRISENLRYAIEAAARSWRVVGRLGRHVFARDTAKSDLASAISPPWASAERRSKLSEDV